MKIKSNDNGNKHYSHNYRVTNSTTADFAHVQPLFCRMMMPKATIKGKLGSFVRLAPMPFPSFGDLRWSAVSRFIPIEDVFPNWAAFMSGKPVTLGNTTASGAIATTVIPTRVFYSSPRQLMAALISSSGNFVLSTSTYTIGVSDPGSTDGPTADPGSTDGPTVASARAAIDNGIDYDKLSLMTFADYYSRYHDVVADGKPCMLSSYDSDGNLQYEVDITDPYTNELVMAVNNGSMTMDDAAIAYTNYHVGSSSRSSSRAADASTVLQAIDSADYTTVSYSGSYTTSSIVCRTFNDRGKHLLKVLQGLGYSLSSDDLTSVSLLPLLAWCKAYFDEFYPNRGSQDWASTSVARFIEYWSRQPSSAFPSSSYGYIAYDSAFFLSVLSFVADSYVVNEADFLSIHTRSLYDFSDTTSDISSVNSEFLPVAGIVNSANSAITVPGSNSVTQSSNLSLNNQVGMYNTPNVPRTSTPVITDVTLKLLTKLTNMFNRDSLIGNRVSMWMQSHLDSDVLERIYKQTNRVSSTDIRIDISDVDSNADMDSADGSVLGAYAGKGVGVGDLTFDYKSSTYGFFIVMGYVKCETGWYQGTDAQLFAISKYEQPQQQFDALGYEVTPFSFIFDDNSISVFSDSSVDNTNGGVVSPSDGYGFGYVPRYSGFKYARNCVNGDLRLHSTSATYAGYYMDRQFINRAVELDTSGTSGKTLRVTTSNLPCATTEYQYQEKYDWMSNYNRIFYNSGSYGVHGALSTLWSKLINKNNTLHYDNFIIHSVIDFTEINSLKPLSMSYDTQMSSSDTDSAVRV